MAEEGVQALLDQYRVRQEFVTHIAHARQANERTADEGNVINKDAIKLRFYLTTNESNKRVIILP